jgi:hypothetical protein
MVLKSKTLNIATDPVAGEVWIRLDNGLHTKAHG